MSDTRSARGTRAPGEASNRRVDFRVVRTVNPCNRKGTVMFAIIIAIVAAVLSLAAPVAVDAQTPTPTLTVYRNTYGGVSIAPSNFDGTTRYWGHCNGASSNPTCVYSGINVNGNCDSDGVDLSLGNRRGVVHSLELVDTAPHWKFGVYSDSTCSTEVASVIFERPLTLPTWGVRDITGDSATIYIQEPFAQQGVLQWKSTFNAGNQLVPPSAPAECERIVAPPGPQTTPTHTLTGLTSGTNYVYGVYNSVFCGYGNQDILVATVRFTTLGGAPPTGPPGPAPPTGVEATAVEATTDGSGSVTLSWSNPGDPDIATYEYYLQRAGGPAGEWRTVAGSNADTTSVTIDLTTGEAVAGNARGVTPPMVEWTIYLRARGVNGAASRATSTVVSTGAGSGGTVVPALPLAGLATLALLLFLGGKRRRNG